MPLRRPTRVIILKTERDLEGMRRAAGLVAMAHAAVAERIRPGVTTRELDAVAEQVIRDHGARPAFKGYSLPGHSPFPATLCISPNDVVVHGMPGDNVLEEGDVVSIDCGVELDGYFGDFAYTYMVGEVSEKKQALLLATKQSLYEGISRAIEGNRLGDIGHAVQSFCEARGYGVVRDLVGHGIGRRMHEDPQVPNYGRRGSGKKLRSGMTICIEPMITAGTAEVSVDADGWTVRTADGEPAAHFEHMVAIRRGEAEVLSSFDAIEAVLAQVGMPIPGEAVVFS
jgi:methionyl aminopeptidase